MTLPMPLFDSDFLKKLEYLSLVSRRVFRGQLLAQRRTMQLGGGIEFADHREYTPGDDFRYLDWNVFARHDELLLKRFQEEEDLHVYILLDCSRSMAFGDPVKFDYARQVAAALAYIALADLDRVAVVAFAGDIVADFPLTRGKARILSLLKFLEGLEPQGSVTDLARMARTSSTAASAGGWPWSSATCSTPTALSGGSTCCGTTDMSRTSCRSSTAARPSPSVKGDVELVDVETGTIQKVTITERNLRQYRKIFADFLESVRRYCNTYGIGGTRSATEIPFDELLLRMMRAAGALA